MQVLRPVIEGPTPGDNDRLDVLNSNHIRSSKVPEEICDTGIMPYMIERDHRSRIEDTKALRTDRSSMNEGEVRRYLHLDTVDVPEKAANYISISALQSICRANLRYDIVMILIRVVRHYAETVLDICTTPQVLREKRDILIFRSPWYIMAAFLHKDMQAKLSKFLSEALQQVSMQAVMQRGEQPP